MGGKIFTTTAVVASVMIAGTALASCPSQTVNGTHTSPDNSWDFHAVHNGRATITKRPLKDATFKGKAEISCVGVNVIIELDMEHADYYCSGKFTSGRSFYLSCDINGGGKGHIDAVFE